MHRRSTSLLIALALLGASSCSKSDPGETKAPIAPTPTADITIKGIDASSLTTRERREWSGQLSELLAPCPEVPVTLVQCIQEQRPCKTCLPAAQFLFKQVQAGKPKKDREEAFHARFDANKIRTVATDGSPEMGPPDAPVTVIEWADFECPFCKVVSPMLDDLVHRFPGQVRLVYKFYPLGVHPHGEPAARAAFAAGNQGKFWEMHHILFQYQEKLEQADLERYARQLNLDLAKFRSDVGSKEASERIEKDKKQADGLGLEGTPFIFINGRAVTTLTNPYDELLEWVKLDIELAGQVPRQALPPQSPSGAGSVGSAALLMPEGSASAAKPRLPPGKK
jgi:protein-disulfide isomerase